MDKAIFSSAYALSSYVLVYGFNISESLNNFKVRVKKEIENLTAMNVLGIDIIAKNIYIPEKEDE